MSVHGDYCVCPECRAARFTKPIFQRPTVNAQPTLTLTMPEPKGEPQSLAFDFPGPLAEVYRPKTLADFAGLSTVRAVLRQLVAKPFASAWLFRGGPGTGKTTTALALAHELGADSLWNLHHVGSQECNLARLQEIVSACQYVPMGGGWHVVIIDEADAMSDAAQKFLLSRLDSSEPLPNTIWIFTCNAIDRLEPRFLSRCRQLHFDAPSESDTRAYLGRIWQEITGTPANGAVSRIAEQRGLNVRDCLMALELEMLRAKAPVAEKG